MPLAIQWRQVLVNHRTPAESWPCVLCCAHYEKKLSYAMISELHYYTVDEPLDLELLVRVPEL